MTKYPWYFDKITSSLIWQYFPLISLVSRLQSWASQIDVSFRPSTCSAVDNKFQLKLDRLFGSRQTKSCLCPFITNEKTFHPINFMQHSPFPDFQGWYLSSQVSFFNNRFFSIVENLCTLWSLIKVIKIPNEYEWRCHPNTWFYCLNGFRRKSFNWKLLFRYFLGCTKKQEKDQFKTLVHRYSSPCCALNQGFLCIFLLFCVLGQLWGYFCLSFFRFNHLLFLSIL